jgi:hypothetical protein
MSHWRTMFADEKYLGAYSLEKDGKYDAVIVTIESIYVGDFLSQGGKEKRPFAKFKEFEKPMVINRTNFKRLEKFFQSFDPTLYAGKQIVLGVENVSSPEGMVPALRFSTRPLPVAQKPELPAAALTKAIESVKSGKRSIEDIEAKYSLTADQREAILNA